MMLFISFNLWIYSLEVAWIREDIMLKCENFVNIPFVNILLRCNCPTLALASVAKENKDVIV